MQSVCVIYYLSTRISLPSLISMGYEPTSFWKKDIDLGRAWRGPDLIGGVSEIFEAFGGVLELLSNVRVPHSIMEGVNQHGTPWHSDDT